MADELKSYYDAASSQIADEWYGNDILMPTLRDFLSVLPPAPRVLDLGCGPGYESMRLHSLGAEVTGVDFSPENIRVARERSPRCRFFEMDFRLLDARYGLFDGIFASASLIHLEPGEMPRVAERMRAVMKAGGRLLTLVKDGEGKEERRTEIRGRDMGWWMNFYSRDLLTDLLRPFEYLRDGVLAKELLEEKWRCYVWGVPG